MHSVVGIFDSQSEAEKTMSRLRAIGLRENDITLLSPSPGPKTPEVPTTETEQPGIGSTIGAVVGGALGASGGMALGTAVATLIVPGLGPVIAVGAAGAAILAAVGAVGGAAVGHALEDSMSEGLPIDEWFLYEHALRHGRSVVIVFAQHDDQTDKAKAIMEEAGAESIDAARESWWVGLRDVEKEDYSKRKGDFDSSEATYRRGFEAALTPACRGNLYDKALDCLKRKYPDDYSRESFRHGYERGQAYHRKLLSERSHSTSG